jgi:hypothetical protein
VENNKARLDLRWLAGRRRRAPVGAALLSENAPAQKRPRSFETCHFLPVLSSRLRQSPPTIERPKNIFASNLLDFIIREGNTLQLACRKLAYFIDL